MTPILAKELRGRSITVSAIAVMARSTMPSRRHRSALRGRRADYRASIQLSENASAQVLNG